MVGSFFAIFIYFFYLCGRSTNGNGNGGMSSEVRLVRVVKVGLIYSIKLNDICNLSIFRRSDLFRRQRHTASEFQLKVGVRITCPLSSLRFSRYEKDSHLNLVIFLVMKKRQKFTPISNKNENPSRHC